MIKNVRTKGGEPGDRTTFSRAFLDIGVTLGMFTLMIAAIAAFG